jgi:hypothetical protein
MRKAIARMPRFRGCKRYGPEYDQDRTAYYPEDDFENCIAGNELRDPEIYETYVENVGNTRSECKDQAVGKSVSKRPLAANDGDRAAILNMESCLYGCSLDDSTIPCVL